MSSRRASIHCSVAGWAIASLIVSTNTAFADDAERDGVDDAIDNCTQLTNPSQRDADADGFGNLCDADVNNDGKVNDTVLESIRGRLGSKDAEADLDDNGVVDSKDYSIAKRQASSGRPGPSSVAVPARQNLANDPPVAQSVEVITGSADAKVGTIEARLSANVTRQRRIARTLVIAPDGEGRC